MKIAILIRRMDTGGAQRQTAVEARGLRARGHDVRITTFYPGGQFEAGLQAAGISLDCIGKKSRWDSLPFALQLLKYLRRDPPDILYTQLNTPNVLGALLRPFLPRTRLVWGVRVSRMPNHGYGPIYTTFEVLERRLASRADMIISNSEAGARDAIASGFRTDDIIVIANGVDDDTFQYDEAGRRRVRAELGVADNEPTIGLVARLDAMKGHDVFLRAAAIAKAERPDMRYLIVGVKPDEDSTGLRDTAETLGVADRVIWRHEREDMPAVYSAIDALALPSLYGEGLSNALIEAMACERPCVVTDIGDSALAVGDIGLVVPPGDEHALAAALLRVFADSEEERRRRGRMARQRVQSHFTDDRQAEELERAFASLLTPG